MKALVNGLIRIYQVLLSPLMPGKCRYWPSCSQYTREAVEKYGAFLGVIIGFRRIVRCHPWHPGGIDPLDNCLEDPLVAWVVKLANKTA